MNERGLTSVNWAVYNNGTKRTRYSSVPTSDITAETVTADGLTVITCRTGHHALRHITRESPRKIGEGLDKRRRSFAPQGRAGNGVPASHPTQPIATRPLAIRKDGTWYTYGWDLTKNICEIFGQHGYLRTAYTYFPYGEVTADGDVTQPIQWSSEYNDTELGLIYYNYRHYNPADGRWIGRDVISDANLYKYVYNSPAYHLDIYGAISYLPIIGGVLIFFGVAVAINSYQSSSRRRAGHVRIYAPDYFGYNESISTLEDGWRKFRDRYTGALLYDYNVYNREEFQETIQLTVERSDEKCIRKLVLAAHGKATLNNESDFEASMEFGNESLTETNISDMFNGIKFCLPCHIELRVCHIGKSQNLKQELSKKYPCSITMYDTFVKP